MPMRLVVDGEAHSPNRWPAVSRAVLVAVSVAAVAVQWLPAGPLRPVAVFGFTLVVPGAAVVLLLPLVDAIERITLSIGLSVALATVVDEALSMAGAASAKTSMLILAGLSCALVAAGIFFPRRRVLDTPARPSGGRGR